MLDSLYDGSSLSAEERIECGVTTVVREVCRLGVLADAGVPMEWPGAVCVQAGLALNLVGLAVLQLRLRDLPRAEELLSEAESCLAFVPTEVDADSL